MDEVHKTNGEKINFTRFLLSYKILERIIKGKPSIYYPYGLEYTFISFIQLRDGLRHIYNGVKKISFVFQTLVQCSVGCLLDKDRKRQYLGMTVESKPSNREYYLVVDIKMVAILPSDRDTESHDLFPV